jgi:5-methylcytosine-specific restriction endonuclease McrA
MYIDKSNKYRLENLDRINAAKKLYRQNNKEKLAGMQKQWVIDRTIEVYNLLGNQCAFCGFDIVAALQVHHKNEKKRKRDWLKKDYDLNNLELLCANCHAILHYKDSRWVE